VAVTFICIEVTVLAHASLTSGTEPDVLAEALQKRYGADGLIAEYRVFKSIDELKNAGLTLAVVKFSFMVDHFVTVFGISNDCVSIGDPLSGRAILTRDEFQRKWRFVGVVLHRRQ